MNKQKARCISALKSQSLSVGILSSPWLKLPETLETLLQFNQRLLHFDIADGQFCPMFTTGAMAIDQFGEPFIKDVHLLVQDPLVIGQQCAKAGADLITVQAETPQNLTALFDWLDEHYPHILKGLSLCPDTALSALNPWLDRLDFVQVLTLDPRTGGKMNEMDLLARIEQLRQKLANDSRSLLINVDGSMTIPLASAIRTQPVDWIVASSGIFKEADWANSFNQWGKH